jgi:type I restriction enzyme S subunit
VDYSINRILSASQTHGMIERNEIEIDIKFEQKTTRKYKIVQPGDYIIYLRSFQGGFAFSNKEGICSPAYSVLRPSNLIGHGFMKDYFMSNKFIKMLKIVTYGIRDGRSINVEEFLKLYITIPSIDEQQKISTSLVTLNNKIQAESRIYSLLVKEKQYLLKQMFI